MVASKNRSPWPGSSTRFVEEITSLNDAVFPKQGRADSVWGCQLYVLLQSHLSEQISSTQLHQWPPVKFKNMVVLGDAAEDDVSPAHVVPQDARKLVIELSKK